MLLSFLIGVVFYEAFWINIGPNDRWEMIWIKGGLFWSFDFFFSNANITKIQKKKHRKKPNEKKKNVVQKAIYKSVEQWGCVIEIECYCLTTTQINDFFVDKFTDEMIYKTKEEKEKIFEFLFYSETYAPACIETLKKKIKTSIYYMCIFYRSLSHLNIWKFLNH